MPVHQPAPGENRIPMEVGTCRGPGFDRQHPPPCRPRLSGPGQVLLTQSCFDFHHSNHHCGNPSTGHSRPTFNFALHLPNTTPSCTLRPSSEKLDKIPQRNLKSASESSFSVIAPPVWNSPPACRSARSKHHAPLNPQARSF